MTDYTFSLYRYQIVPMLNRDGLFYSIDNLIKEKNKIFSEILESLKYIHKGKYKFEIIKKYIDKYIIVISNKKNVKIYNEDHTIDLVSSFPPVYVLIDNNKNEQIIAVQNSRYYSPRTIVNSILDSIRPVIKKKDLRIECSPIYKRSGFWDFIDAHHNDIASIHFEIITPNMSSISASLREDIKKMARETNAITTSYSIDAGSDSVLNINKNNEDINGLVDYTSEGGGEIRIKLKNSKSQFNTNDFQIKKEISELELSGNPKDLFTLIVEASRDSDS